MSNDNLPLKVDPFRFADHAVSLQGEMLVKDMPRLCSGLKNHAGEVNVHLQFGVDEQGIRFLKGDYEVLLMLECQRCMGTFSYPAKGHFLLGIVEGDDEAVKLPEVYDPVIAKGGILLLLDVIEDELIVSLPLVPMHSASECRVKFPLSIDSTDDLNEEKVENPFKVIESLREKKRGGSS
jgi:uncharacterized protein